jgi:hypothetical protein
MGRMSFFTSHRALQIRCSVTVAALLLSAVIACSEDRVADERPLSSLSSQELGTVCDELRANWPRAGQTLACQDGSTVSLAEFSSESCSGVSASSCSASVGDVRACNDASLADPCAAFAQRPDACAPLAAAGCGTVEALSLPMGDTCRTLQPSDVAPLEGVYELVRHTENTDSCAAEGASRLDSDTEQLFVLVGVDFFGTPMAAIQSCADRAGCLALAERIRQQSQNPMLQALDPAGHEPERHQLIQCRGASSGVLRAGGFSVGNDLEGNCRLTEEAIDVTRSADGVVRLEGRTAAWTKPQAPDGCSYTPGDRPADAACARLEVQEGRLLSALR